MATCPTTVWASGPAAEVTEPSVSTQLAGFGCGPADHELFNWLFQSLTHCIIEANSRLDALENASSGSTSGGFGTGIIGGTSSTTTGGTTTTGGFGSGTIN